MNKISHTLVLLFAVFLIIPIADAIVATLGTGKVVLSVDVTLEDSGFADSEIIVRNTNEERVRVRLSLKGDLEKRTLLDEKDFYLDPDESKNIPFSVEVTKPGRYEGTIVTQFSYASTDKKGSASLGASITVNAKGEGDFSDIPDYPEGYEDLEEDEDQENINNDEEKIDLTKEDQLDIIEEEQEDKAYDSNFAESISVGNVVDDKNTETDTEKAKTEDSGSFPIFLATIIFIIILVATSLIIILKKI